MCQCSNWTRSGDLPASFLFEIKYLLSCVARWRVTWPMLASCPVQSNTSELGYSRRSLTSQLVLVFLIQHWLAVWRSAGYCSISHSKVLLNQESFNLQFLVIHLCVCVYTNWLFKVTWCIIKLFLFFVQMECLAQEKLPTSQHYFPTLWWLLS